MANEMMANKDEEIAYARSTFITAAKSLGQTVADMSVVEQVMGRLDDASEDAAVQTLRTNIRENLNPSLTSLREKMDALVAWIDKAMAAEKLQGTAI